MPDPVDLIFNYDAAGNIPNIQSGALIAALVGQGLVAKKNQAGEEQRALIDELAVDILIKHHNEDEAGAWPFSYNGKLVMPVIKVLICSRWPLCPSVSSAKSEPDSIPISVASNPWDTVNFKSR